MKQATLHQTIAAVFAMLAVSTTSTQAQSLFGENLRTPVPKGFKIGASHSNGPFSQMEYIAESETVQDWNVMITISAIKGTLPVTPDQFSDGIGQGFQRTCAHGSGKKVSEGSINGYAYTEWQMTCDLNPMTNKPEFMVSRAIQGQDAFFNVQYAFRKAPTDALIHQAADYFATVTMCDTRLADKPCD